MTLDLGFIQAIHKGAAPPTNTAMIWYDTGINLHKYYDTGGGSWVALASGASSLALVLASGNATLGNSMIVSPGDALLFENSGFQSSLEAGTLTANRTVQLPDKSGTIALMSDIISANTLNSTLSAGQQTLGIDILMSAGDILASSVGDAYLDLRDGSTNYVKLKSGNSLTLLGTGVVSVESNNLILLNAGITNAFTNVGAGFNEGTPESICHVGVSQAAPSVGSADVLKIKSGSVEAHIGISASRAHISSYSGWLSLESRLGVGVDVGSNDPKAGSLNISLGVGDVSVMRDRYVGLYAHASSSASYKTYKGAQEILSIGHDVAEDVLVRNSSANANIGFSMNVGGLQKEALTLLGAQDALKMNVGLRVQDALWSFGGAIVGALSPTISEGKQVIYMDLGSGSAVTSIAGGESGRIISLINVTAFNITILHGSGTLGWQINCPGSTNITVGPGSSVTFVYDRTGIIPVWRVLSQS